MSKTEEITKRINEWIGETCPQTKEAMAALIWVMATDDILYKMITAEVGVERDLLKEV